MVAGSIIHLYSAGKSNIGGFPVGTPSFMGVSNNLIKLSNVLHAIILSSIFLQASLIALLFAVMSEGTAKLESSLALIIYQSELAKSKFAVSFVFSIY